MGTTGRYLCCFRSVLTAQLFTRESPTNTQARISTDSLLHWPVLLLLTTPSSILPGDRKNTQGPILQKSGCQKSTWGWNLWPRSISSDCRTSSLWQTTRLWWNGSN